MGGTGVGTTHYYPLWPTNTCLLPVPATLCSFGLRSKGKNTSPGDTTVISLNWKLNLSFSHFGLCMPLNKQAKKGVTVLAGWLMLTTKGKVDYYSMTEVRRTLSGIEDPLGCLLVLPCLLIKVNANYNNSIQAGLLMVQTIKLGSLCQVKIHNQPRTCWKQREYRVGSIRS